MERSEATSQIEEQSLAERLSNEQVIQPTIALRILNALCQTLVQSGNASAHGDINPANILVAKLDATTSVRLVHPDATITSTSLADGTGKTPLASWQDYPDDFKYLSPEQWKGETIDERTDIYALGCVFFRMLTGITPFQGKTALKLFMQHTNVPPPPLSSVNNTLKISDATEELTAKMLAKNPADRYPNIAALKDAILTAQKSYNASGFPLSSKQFDRQKYGADSTLPISLVCFFLMCALTWLWFRNETVTTQATTVPIAEKKILKVMPHGRFPAAQDWSSTTIFSMNKLAEGQVRVVLPITFSSGWFHWWDSDGKYHLVDARGELKLPGTAKIIYDFDSEFAANQDFRQWLRSADFWGLVIKKPKDVLGERAGYDGSQTGMEKLSIPTSVRVLWFKRLSIPKQLLERMSNLPHLCWLAIDQEGMRRDNGLATALTGFKNLKNLKLLNCYGTCSMTPVLEKLKGSTRLKRLALEGCGVTAKDIDLISTMTELDTLEIAGATAKSEQDGITSKLFQILPSFKKLKNLSIQLKLFGRPLAMHEIPDSAIERLKEVESLKILIIKGDYEVPIKTTKLEKALPKVRIITADGGKVSRSWFDPRGADPDSEELW